MLDKSENTLKHIEKLLEVVSTLRGPSGCPWDKEQTLNSLKPYIIEESYEVIDAIESNNAEKHKEELGDTLLHIIMQAKMQEEKGNFNFIDVVKHITEKLIRRHPHVFGNHTVKDSKEVLHRWEKIKADERKYENNSVLSSLPKYLPALQLAHRVQERAAIIGFDWPDREGVRKKIDEELSEVDKAIEEGKVSKIAEEIGDLLFSLVNLCRAYNLNAEELLRRTTQKFISRFQIMEEKARVIKNKKLSECNAEEMDFLWEEAKKELKKD